MVLRHDFAVLLRLGVPQCFAGVFVHVLPSDLTERDTIRLRQVRGRERGVAYGELHWKFAHFCYKTYGELFLCHVHAGHRA
jgi:hypothetical protein